MSRIHISYRSPRHVTRFPANASTLKPPRSPRIRSIVICQKEKKDKAPDNTTKIALAVGLSLIVAAGAAWAYYHPELVQKWTGKMSPAIRSPVADNLATDPLLTGEAKEIPAASSDPQTLQANPLLTSEPLQAIEKALPALATTIPLTTTNPLLLEDLLKTVEKAIPTNITSPDPVTPPQMGLQKVFTPPSPRIFDALHLHSLGRAPATSSDGLVIHLEQSSDNKWESSVGPQNQSPSSTGYLRTG